MNTTPNLPAATPLRQVAMQQASNMTTEMQRAVAEVQGAIFLAKQFPRDRVARLEAIKMECTRKALAEQALYSYNRGGGAVDGPTIRLAEMLAQSWGNFQFGWDEVSRIERSGDKPGYSDIIAWAWDLETNVKRPTKFVVQHVRDSKQGRKLLTDERDIYETCANNAARRMRQCILNLIPGDVIDAAMDQCEKTLAANETVTPETITKMEDALSKFGVTRQQIEKKVNRKLESINSAVMMQLRKIYTSLNDGMSEVSDWFDPVVVTQANPPATQAAAEKPKEEVKPVVEKTVEKPVDKKTEEEQKPVLQPTQTTTMPSTDLFKE